MLDLPDKDPSQEKGPWQGTRPLAHRGSELMNQVAEVALQPVHQFVEMKDQMEAVQLDITVMVPVQVKAKLGELVMVLEFVHQQAVDDGIYKLHQTCIAPFSHNRNTLSHPVIIYKNSAWSKLMP